MHLLIGVMHLKIILHQLFDTRFLAAFANAAILTMFSHYNVDLVPSTKIVSDDEIEQKFHENRELCKKTNLQRIEKKNKERRS